ncbi:MAG: hypothetical protein ACO3VI_04660 [Ilumatobacteraceae bacterium]
MSAVMVMAVMMPVLWFGLWIPILMAIARVGGMKPAQAAGLSVLGPIGALVALGVSRASKRPQVDVDW